MGLRAGGNLLSTLVLPPLIVKHIGVRFGQKSVASNDFRCPRVGPAGLPVDCENRLMQHFAGQRVRLVNW